MNDHRMMYGHTNNQIPQYQALDVAGPEAIAQLQKQYAAQAGKQAGVLDLIAGALDALSGLQQTVAGLEQRLGGVLRIAAPEPEGCAADTAQTTDAHAVDTLRLLLTRISQTTAMVSSIHDRVQV